MVADNTKSRPKGAKAKRALTRKGRHTRAGLLDAACDVFREQGYYSASVSEISRRAGMSQGAFYQYFKNKEQAFLELNDLIIDSFWTRAQSLSLENLEPGQRLVEVTGLLLDHARQHYYFHRILGEFELIDPVAIAYWASIARYCRGYFRWEISLGRFRPIDPNLLAYALIGMAAFQAMDWGPDEETYQPQDLAAWTAELFLRGVSGATPWKRPADLIAGPQAESDGALVRPADNLTKGQATALAILQAAERVFGRCGFNRAGIADITREAGVAQGTFYVHFKSKRDLMENVVRYLSREMRRELKTATAQLQDRRDAERVGVTAFFNFLGPHRQIYRVVAESETMGQEMAMWYYKKLASGYTPGLAEGVAKGEIRNDLPVPFMVRSLMGYVHMVGLKWLVWNSSPGAEFPRHLLADTVDFMIDGLQPSRQGRRAAGRRG